MHLVYNLWLAQENRWNSEENPCSCVTSRPIYIICSYLWLNTLNTSYISLQRQKQLPPVVALPDTGSRKKGRLLISTFYRLLISTFCLQGPWNRQIFLNFHYLFPFLWWKTYWDLKRTTFSLKSSVLSVIKQYCGLQKIIFMFTFLDGPQFVFPSSPLALITVTALLVNCLYNPIDWSL
jgi:hypothetical protein